MYVGYRISRYSNGTAISGADSRQSHSLDTWTPIQFKGMGTLFIQ